MKIKPKIALKYAKSKAGIGWQNKMKYVIINHSDSKDETMAN